MVMTVSRLPFSILGLTKIFIIILSTTGPVALIICVTVAIICCQRKKKKRKLRDKDHALKMSLRKMDMSPQAKRRTPYSSRDDLDGLGSVHEYDYITSPHTFIAPPGPLPPYDYSPPYDYPSRGKVSLHDSSSSPNHMVNNHIYHYPRKKGAETVNHYPVNNVHINNQPQQGYSSDPRLNSAAVAAAAPTSNDSVRYGPSPGSLRRSPRSQSPHHTGNKGGQPSGRVASSTALQDEDKEQQQSPALPPRNYISDGNINQSISVTV